MTSLEEQREIRRTVGELLDQHAGMPRIRDVMATLPGVDVPLWGRLAELGLTAMLVPDHIGGMGTDFRDASVVMEEAGRRLVPVPVSETLVATAVLAACATPAADAVLREVAESGWAVSSIGPGHVAASSSGGGARLDGTCRFVPFGATSDLLLVAATTPDGPGLFAVSGNAAGHRARMTLDQTRRLADVDLDDVPAERVSADGDGGRVVALLGDLTLVSLAVESAAAASVCLDLTVGHLTMRHQFGRPLGSFQALKHRCADHAVAVQGAIATATHAAEAAAATLAGNSEDDLAVLAPLAKLVCADVFRDVAGDAIQLHGGIGFTFEHDIHLYFKRAKAHQALGADRADLRRRLGQAAGL